MNLEASEGQTGNLWIEKKTRGVIIHELFGLCQASVFKEISQIIRFLKWDEPHNQ